MSPTPGTPSPTRRSFALLLGLSLGALPHHAGAQVSLSTAVDLALHNSPRVRMAQADVAKAEASLSEARDVYIPAVTAGAGIGNSYGYSPNPPTLFAFNAQSLIYGSSQRSYIRSSRFGLTATGFALNDARQAVAEDSSLSYLALHHDLEREAILTQENDDASHLVQIVQDRFDAGRDTAIDLTNARLTAARFRLARLNAEDETAHDRDHLARLMGLSPTASLNPDADFPALPTPSANVPLPPLSQPATPGVASAFASADAKQQLAIGDARYLYRPQLSLIVQYNRYATFTNSFKQLQSFNQGINIAANEGVFAVQITLPFYDKVHQAKARESLADAQHARAEAENAQLTALDGQFKLRHSIALLQARSEVAALDQQLAQQQLDALTAQLNGPATAGPLSTPKDEQNARIAEREKFLALLDARYQLQQTQINLLRQSGQLEPWLQHLAATANP